MRIWLRYRILCLVSLLQWTLCENDAGRSEAIKPYSSFSKTRRSIMAEVLAANCVARQNNFQDSRSTQLHNNQRCYCVDTMYETQTCRAPHADAICSCKPWYDITLGHSWTGSGSMVAKNRTAPLHPIIAAYLLFCLSRSHLEVGAIDFVVPGESCRKASWLFLWPLHDRTVDCLNVLMTATWRE